MAISLLETSRHSSNITLQNGIKLDKYAKVHKQAMLNNIHRNITSSNSCPNKIIFRSFES
jgi:hypothetical protein